MQNRATNLFAASATRVDSRWQSDSPRLRLFWLYTAILLPLLGICGRIAHVKCSLLEPTLQEFQKTTVVYESLPCRDGRILSMDGHVLAEDERHFHIAMHYRWLEEPADEHWLRQRAASSLHKRFRRNRERIEAARQRVLEQRENMWQRLATLTHTPLDELHQARHAIQERVERIHRSVLERQQQRWADVTRPEIDEDQPWWIQVRHVLQRELTTPPSRGATQRLVIQEELDYHEVLRDVSFEIKAEIEAHPELYPGLRVLADHRRVYPQHTVAAHLVGARTPVQPEELTSAAGSDEHSSQPTLQLGDRLGRSGIEQQYDAVLRGVRGRKKIVMNRRGEILQTQVVREPQNGQDVYLTLNLPLQQATEDILDSALQSESDAPSRGGAALVALEVHTGEVLVSANAPRFDANLLIAPSASEWQALLSDPRQPLFPRDLRMAIAPGSVFKIVSALALLESGLIDPDEPLECIGYLHHPNRYRCYTYRHYGHGHGPTTLEDALMRSCNVYFYTAAEKLGPQPFIHWAQRLGFGTTTGIDIPGERSGNVPFPGQTTQDGQPVPWYRGDSLGLAIGQSRLTVTPLQIARLLACVANGGFLVTPRVVGRGGPSLVQDDAASESATARPVPGLSQETLQRIREGLRQAVANPRGTGYKYVRLSEVAIAGKTGTAETGGAGDHAWFAGFVPAQNPRIAFAVVLEHGGSGGAKAGPLARQFVEALLAQGVIQQTQLAENAHRLP